MNVWEEEQDQAGELGQALVDAAGAPRTIERVTFEPLPTGEFRWSIWCDGEEVFADLLPAADLGGMLNVSSVLLRTALGEPPVIERIRWN
jgi:hypothetical protein